MKARPQRLALEPLEDRTLMSTCHVTRLSDIGAGNGFVGDLRYCIKKVNAAPGADVIDFSVTGTINLNSFLPGLVSDIDIQGPGAELLTIRRDSGGLYRIFSIYAGDVRISGLTISNGQVNGSDVLYSVINGGGIYNEGILTLSQSVISDNDAFNTATFGTGRGGGIANFATMTILQSVVKGNGATGRDTGVGGGIYNKGTLTVVDSVIADNYADGANGYAYHPSGGGIYNEATLSVYRSTISGNFLKQDYPGGDRPGTGIYTTGTMILSNSTVSGHRGTRGAGIFAGGGLTTITNSTIADNVAECCYMSFGYGGGIYGAVIMSNTILADNRGGKGPNIYGSIHNSAYNLIGRADGGSGYGPTDILGADPLIGPLAENGGPTKTHALMPGSPAIEAGNNDGAPKVDQRGPGYLRIVTGTIDIGAFEVQSTGASHQPDFLAFLITADFDQDE